MSLAAVSRALWFATVAGFIGLVVGYRLGQKDARAKGRRKTTGIMSAHREKQREANRYDWA